MTQLSSVTDVVSCLQTSFQQARENKSPYRHWFASSCVPDDILSDINHAPFKAPDLDGLSGKRELHNATRNYFDIENCEKYPSCAAFAQGFQEASVIAEIENRFDTNLNNTYLRIEYAQDTNGFWLEPHSDLGVKVFTMLLYVSKDPSHANLGTDIYDINKTHVGCSPFAANEALIFVPADDTFHGFEKRKIDGIRKSIIINYVTDEWRAREQLAFPENPIFS